VVSGWVAFGAGPTAKVEAWLDETPLGRARLGLPRPDVAPGAPGPDAAIRGFELRAAIEQAGAEREAQLRVVAESTAGERREFEPIAVRVGDGSGAPAPAPPTRPSRTAPGADGRRVLAFTNVLSLGGASIYFFELLRRAKQLGRLQPTVVTAIDGPLRAELEAEGVPVHLLGPLALEDAEAYGDRVEELAAWASQGDFELVFVNTATGLTLPGADVAAQLQIPAVWAIHESFPMALLWEGLAQPLRERAEEALRRAALAIFEAEATRQLYLGSIAPERSVAEPYGIDLAPIEASRGGFDRDRARREAGLSEDAELVICVGTVEPRKAQVPLLQAFELVAERHPRARLAYVGATEAAGSIALEERTAVSPYRDRVTIVPQVRDVGPWYGMADLLVCASDIESLPRVVLEAMAWGTPVLATAVFGLAELIDHGQNGWLCEPGDVAALAAGLGTALDTSAPHRRQIGAVARQVVLERHELDSYTRKVADLFDRVADGESVRLESP
jgi:glycosyltransferase involved in cell wall biosynthesis